MQFQDYLRDRYNCICNFDPSPGGGVGDLDEDFQVTISDLPSGYREIDLIREAERFYKEQGLETEFDARENLFLIGEGGARRFVNITLIDRWSGENKRVMFSLVRALPQD